MIQNNEQNNVLNGHVFNQNFHPQEYEMYLNQERQNRTEDQFEDFRYLNRNVLFGKWKRNVYNLVYSEIQISLDDLPDFTYRLNFEESKTPNEMSIHILANLP